MADLLLTSRFGGSGGGHYHVAFLSDKGQGITSLDKNHQHGIRYVPGKPSADGMAPPTEGKWEVLPAGEDNHTHDLTDYGAKEKNTGKEGSEELVLEQFDADYLDSELYDRKNLDSGIKAENMYMGDQWLPEHKRLLKAKKRACITVNELENKIDNLTGYQRQNRTDFKFLPMESGDSDVADILTIYFKFLTDNMNYDREESKIFEDQAIVGRGIYHIYDDRDKNVAGDLVVERWPWDELLTGPHEKEDLSDCEYIFKVRWFSKSLIKQTYPDKADLLVGEERTSRNPPSTRSEDWQGRSKDVSTNPGKLPYKVVERLKRIYKRVSIIANADERFFFNAEDWKEQDITKAKTLPGFSVIPRVKQSIRLTTVCGKVVLVDEFPDLPHDGFPVEIAWGKKRKGKWWGKVATTADLQRVVNYAYSTFVDIVNRMAAYGWFYDSDTFHSVRDQEKFRNTSAQPGFTQKVRNVAKIPVKVEGAKVPNEVINLIVQLDGKMKEIMNINLEQLGIENGQQSGIALRQKIVQQLLGNDFLFDNLSMTKKNVGRKMLSIVKRTHTPDRILRVVSNVAQQKQQIEISGRTLTPPELEQQLDVLRQKLQAQLFDNPLLVTHDVIVGESQSSPSAMMASFSALLELAGKGVAISPQAILEVAPIPNRDRVIQITQEAQQAAAQQENKKYDTEIEKSKIAASAKQEKQQLPLSNPEGILGPH